jgi:tRNA-splicing endonuclease subunit Sen54
MTELTKTQASIFSSFRIIPTISPYIESRDLVGSPYQVFFHVWKPETSWNRMHPARPDFDVVVIKYLHPFTIEQY